MTNRMTSNDTAVIYSGTHSMIYMGYSTPIRWSEAAYKVHTIHEGVQILGHPACNPTVTNNKDRSVKNTSQP